MSESIKPNKVDETFKLVLHSQDATIKPDNSFNFRVNLKEIDGDVLRCAVKKVRYLAPATYISRRLWFADGNTWKNSFTDPLGRVNDYNNLLTKYGLNVWIYLYYPSRNMYLRILWNNTENTQVRQTIFSSSLDGVNWSGNTTATGIGLVAGVDFSGGASAFFDCYEIDITTQPVATNLQNIHCPELRASMSYDTITNNTTDIIGNIGRVANFNPYVVNDITNQIKDEEVCHELSGNGLRGLTNLNIYFSRVATPYVKEPILASVFPWVIELNFFKVL